MKTFFIAMVLAFMPTVANATVTIKFNGVADAASYTNTQSGTDSSIVNDSGTPSVSGTLVISLASLTNQPGSSVYYDAGGAAFLSGSFASSGVTPSVLGGGTPGQYVAGDNGDTATIELGYFDAAAIDTAAAYYSIFTLFGEGVPLKTIGGINLPDFASATNVYFSLTSRRGNEQNYVESVSSGFVTAISVAGPAAVTAAVPEPASWAMMMLGLGMTGAALRRRRPAGRFVAA